MKGALTLEDLVLGAVQILIDLGVPMEGLSMRRRARVAKAFLAVGGLKPGARWDQIRSDDPAHRLRSRDVIVWMNRYLGEAISSGSYDDIRRKDLILPVQAGIVLKSAGKEGAATNDGTRAYAINPDFAEQIRKFGTATWSKTLSDFMAEKKPLIDELYKRRSLARLPVDIGGEKILFSPGEHNRLQKAIIEKFLPRFGNGAEVLYAGDTSNKALVYHVEALKRLRFFELSHDTLPDIVAYSRERNWLFLVEAVHAANPIDPVRKLILEKLTKACTANIVFVTAFATRAVFRRFASQIAWETEVWIAGDPDHLIHFNGDKFLGPYPA